MHENEESSNNSMDNFSFDENEDETPSEEVLCKEEVICCSNDSNFSDYHTNGIAAISLSEQLGYD